MDFNAFKKHKPFRGPATDSEWCGHIVSKTAEMSATNNTTVTHLLHCSWMTSSSVLVELTCCNAVKASCSWLISCIWISRATTVTQNPGGITADNCNNDDRHCTEQLRMLTHRKRNTAPLKIFIKSTGLSSNISDFIYEVLGSNLRRDADRFSWFLQSVQVNVWNMPDNN